MRMDELRPDAKITVVKLLSDMSNPTRYPCRAGQVDDNVVYSRNEELR